MGIDYESLRDSVSSILAENTAAMTLIEKVSGEFDPSKSRISDTQIKKHPCYGGMSNYELKDIDGSRIKQGDMKATINAGPDIPLPTTRMTLKTPTGEWKIMDVLPISPAGIDVVYNLQLRR